MAQMVRYLVFVLFALVSNTYGNLDAAIKSSTSEDDQTFAVQDLVKRIFGNRSDSFDIRVNLTLIDDFDGKDGFKIFAQENKISIRGTSGYAAANGLNYYIRKFLHGQFTWSGQSIFVPQVLPKPANAVTVELPDKVRYYANVCTSSYSFVWWEWPRWEREIDWMALNGINLPLAFTGQEIVAREVFRKLGCQDSDIDPFFSGPAFLAWNRMGNMRGFGGPLPISWIEQQQMLQMMILKRMRDFGMTPVLPGFNGFLPRAVEKLYPETNFTRASRWCNFPDEYASPTFLPPTEPFFANVSRLYTTTYTSVYGSDHLYNIDLFNELEPSSDKFEDLQTMGATVYNALKEADEKAIWVMQAWLFLNDNWSVKMVQGFVTGAPIGKMLLLDLYSEQRPVFDEYSNYFGQPFVWCMLHNFGGNDGLFGNLDWMNDAPLEARSIKNMVGIGMTPEGTGQNEIIYEFMAENSYRSEAENITEWVRNYATARYFYTDTHIEQAWNLLQQSVYNLDDKGTANHGGYILTQRPELYRDSLIWYNNSDVFEAARQFILSSKHDERRCHQKLFHEDFVDVVRQALQVRVSEIYQELMENFEHEDLKQFTKNSKKLIDALHLLDHVLQTDENFLLGKWINDARSAAGKDQGLRNLFEFNARNQVTRWGPNGEIQDYASKMWAGLVRDYLTPRWRIFIATLKNSLKTKTPVDKDDLENEIVEKAEIPFTNSKKKYPFRPIGNICHLRDRITKTLSAN